MPPCKPCGQNTCKAKKTARLPMTPTTAAVMPVSGAVKCGCRCVVSMNGAPTKMNTNDGKNVNQVATVAPVIPESTAESGPNTACVHAPTKPTKATTMISGPGVVSPSASPSIICVGVSH